MDGRVGLNPVLQTEPVLDLWFPLTGTTVPVDHGYTLYAALIRRLEAIDLALAHRLHDAESFGLHRVRGVYVGGGLLEIDSAARLGLRVPAGLVPGLTRLAGSELILGEYKLRLGIPRPTMLVPASDLYAHLVTTKNGIEEVRFRQELARQLESLGAMAEIRSVIRRTFRIKDRQIVAYSTSLTIADVPSSLRVQ